MKSRAFLFFASLQLLVMRVRGGALNGSHLRVAGIGFPPYLNLANYEEGVIPPGIDTDLLAILAQKLNFTFDFYSTKIWGVFQNGVWKGTIGKVHNGTADVGIGHVTINSQRVSFVDISVPVYFLDLKFFTRRPQPLPQHFNLIKPFTAASWLGISLSVVFFLLLAMVLTKAGNDVFTSVDSDLIENIIRVIGLFIGQAIVHARTKWLPISKHIFLLSAFFFTTLILMAYECNLRAYLMSVDFEKPIDTAKDLVEQNRNLYIGNGAGINTIIKQSQSPYFQKLYRDIVEKKLYFKSSARRLTREMEDKILNEGGAIISTESMTLAEVPSIQRRFGYNPFRMSKEGFVITYSGFAFKKDSVLKGVFDPLLQSLQDCGIIQKVRAKNLPRVYEEESLSQEGQLKLDHLIFSIIFLVSAWLVAAFCFALELIIANF